MSLRFVIILCAMALLPTSILSASTPFQENVRQKTILTCSEYADDVSINEEQIHSDKCTYSYVETDDSNDIQLAPIIVKDVDYEGGANDIDASPHITTVHFVSSRLSKLPSQIFQKFINMKTLNCDGVNLQSLSRTDMFGSVSLKDFSCNSNYVKSLDMKLFENSLSMENIDISINDIESIDATSFSGLSQLKKLLLYDNKLSSLSVDTFKDLINLEEINLSNNQIQIIEQKLFSSCKALKYIYLNDNLIANVHVSAFENNMHIEFLEMSNNQLTALKLNASASGLYANNNQLKWIHLGSIGYLSFYNNSISDVTFTLPHDILSLNMSTNNLSGNSLNGIIQCSALKSLDLSFNNLGKLNVSTFLELNDLQILNLQSTNLSAIDYGLFQHQIKLEQMDISYNKLGTMSGGFDLNKFIPLKSLTTLFIEGNNLSELDYENIKTIFPRLRSIGYTDNPWNCSYLILMNNFMDRNGIEIYHLVTDKTVSNVGGIACDSSSSSSNDDDKKVNSEVNYEDKLHSSSTIKSKPTAAAHHNELSVITKRFEEILMNISTSHSHNSKQSDDYVSKSELINELSMIKSSIATLQGDFLSITKRLDKLSSTHNNNHNDDGMIDVIKSIRNSSYDMKMMTKRLVGVESMLENFKKERDQRQMQIERENKQSSHVESSHAKATNTHDDFLVKAMISIIFVIVCGFVAIYIIKLCARRYRHHHHHHRDLSTYTDGDTIDENIIL